MAVKLYRPTSAGRRGMTTQDLSEITSKRSVRRLITIKKQNSGRNHRGVITSRHRGAGRRRFYRLLSDSLPEGFSGVVKAIEYDPNRSARIALIISDSSEARYVVAQQGMSIGQMIHNDATSALEVGNRMRLEAIPVGTEISAIEIMPGGGAQMVRSAGVSAQLMAKENGLGQIRLPSGEIRAVSLKCTAAIGKISNELHQNISVGKAGRSRHKGIRPRVRGVVMNAVDHPHGGGDGGTHAPGKDPRTPWGKKTMGYKTRKRKSTNRYIIKSRHLTRRG